MTFEELKDNSLRFRNEREWTQFHNPKDLALSISLEAAELLDCFQWSAEDLIVAKKREAMTEELSDIFNYCILMADVLGIDMIQATSDKIDKNAKKYPIDKAKGSSAKYTEL